MLGWLHGVKKNKTIWYNGKLYRAKKVLSAKSYFTEIQAGKIKLFLKEITTGVEILWKVFFTGLKKELKRD